MKVPNKSVSEKQNSAVWIYSLFTDFDTSLFLMGKHFRLYEKLGAHLIRVGEVEGTFFAVWAPNALSVSVVGNFNGWNKTAHHLYRKLDSSGIWEGFIPGLGQGEVYKYAIKATDGRDLERGDPFARKWEHPPHTASIIWDTNYSWKDKTWLNK
eukprot:gene20759-24665_t